MRAIDLNADLGETVDGVPTADDEAMFAVVSSANVACGGHAGDDLSMRDSVARAQRHGVAIGAHPSYPDRPGFGRAAMTMDAEGLRESVAQQLAALGAAGADIRYVKPHGALYHAAGIHPTAAAAVVAAVADLAADLGRPLPVLGLGDELARATRAVGLPFLREAFLDRGYTASGALVPRGAPGALLSDPDAVADRALRLVEHGEIVAVDGAIVSPDAASLCLHGDSPAAVAMARAVRAALAAAAVEVRAPW
ncbi:5-oxoprolinase subunit PxpA [Microbacterium sp. 18062]|uniref:5-oxoprolinase subunit PxpA n=1 Tax=Microbacterium sp. 18062 TaxID=2681410 RepID=UPI001359CECE|nr:5-oxoprolinase subunit PxpA [Microbacterium sp. 18062]